MLLEFFLDLVRLDLTHLKGVNQFLVVQNIALCLGKHLQDLIFSRSLFILIFEKLFDILLSLLLFIRFFDFHDDVEHLIFKSLRSHHEIQQSHLHTNLWRVMRVRKFCGHVKPKVVWEIQYFFPHFELPLTTLLNLFVLEHCFEKWVNILSNVLQQYRIPVWNRVFNLKHQVVLRHILSQHYYLVLTRHFPYPLVCLQLRVNQQWPKIKYCLYIYNN